MQVVAAILLFLLSTVASAAMHCTNGKGDSVEWFPGKPRPVLDLTPGKDFICFVGGEYTMAYVNDRFPGLLVQGQQTILVGDQARFLLLNVVKATRADYDALIED